MTLYEIYETVNYLMKKNISGNTFTPVEFNRMLRYATWTFYNKMMDHYEKAQELTDSMQHFVIQEIAEPVVNSVILLSDLVNYNQLDSVSYLGNPVDILTNSQLKSRLNDAIASPTFKNPVAAINNNRIWFYPKEIRYVDITYLREPVDPVFAYTTNANDNLVYNPAGSTELDFRNADHINVISIILESAGLHLKQSDIVQYSKMIETEQEPK